MATTSTAGAIIVTATALLVALVAAQAPASAPGPSITTAGVPGPSMTTAGAPGPSMTTAGAPGPGGPDCLSNLLNMSDCLTYVQEGSNLTTPDKACCPELAGLVESQPICLCQLLGSTLGIQIDFQKALKLPSVCSVETPPASLCSVAGYPIGVPMPSEAPSSPGNLSMPGEAPSSPGNLSMPGVAPSPTGIDGKMIAISASISASVVFLVIGSVIYCQRRRKKTEEEKKRSSQEVQLLDLAQVRIVNDFNTENFEGERQVKSQDFPSVQLDLILEATKQFSEENKLGEGGFGPVYKGTLPDGKEIAVKRLSRNSGQGLQEFKNEISLIARLQHRNLVRLLGCCLERNELILIYEYMPNKSLDFFLFDSAKAAQLDWSRRFLIINGIVRGLLYLHEDSRLRIIHRDLKVSNILLDQEMNPKISDFGMARIFGGNQSEANTNRVVGTYGYMAPEYAMEGLFSIKSDVFSFGVLLLEIISGKKNSGFYLSEHGHSLLTYTWNLWCKGEGKLELMDPLLVESCVEAEVLKCIQIGLLCVQEDPVNRPTMSSVVRMLGSDIATLPQPTQPAFSVGRLVLNHANSHQMLVVSVNEMTISDVSPR